MSTPLDVIDLSAKGVGATGIIDLTRCAPTSNPHFITKSATLVLYNESGSGLRLTGKNTGLSFDLPAGAWLPQAVPAGETEIDYVVLYLLNSAPVSKLLATYYQPGEPVTGAVLGNSPIGLATNVPLNATATSIANDGNVTGTEFIESSVGGVKHISGQNQGFLQFLQDATGGNKQVLSMKDLAVTADEWGVYLLSARGLSFFNSKTGTINLVLESNGGVQIDGGAISTDGSGNLTTKSYKGSSGGSWKARSFFNGTGGGAVAHGLGTTPTQISLTNSNGGAAIGYTAVDATNVTVSAGMGLTWTAEASA